MKQKSAQHLNNRRFRRKQCDIWQGESCTRRSLCTIFRSGHTIWNQILRHSTVISDTTRETDATYTNLIQQPDLMLHCRLLSPYACFLFMHAVPSHVQLTLKLLKLKIEEFYKFKILNFKNLLWVTGEKAVDIWIKAWPNLNYVSGWYGKTNAIQN
jgi:hypothetical protein